MRQSAVSFEANGLKFEGILSTPDDLPGNIPGVSCVILTLCLVEHAQKCGIRRNLSSFYGGDASLKFNFRGVGNRRESTQRRLEYQEVVAAQKMLSEWPGINSTNMVL
ncbi:MAG: hypothetical protein CM1200mP15_20090 [Dehalococcoidia bacterium]|nr:MAG: hypothetical protein CM1200mP15_20090 [Dehalococcoidia bacterium]